VARMRVARDAKTLEGRLVSPLVLEFVGNSPIEVVSENGDKEVGTCALSKLVIDGAKTKRCS